MRSHAPLSIGLLLATTMLTPARAEEAEAGPKVEEIIVTGSPGAKDADDLVTIVGVVTRDQILQSGGANLADALSNVPGVTSTGFASGASRPVIRGFDANRVRLLEDGIGSFDVSEVGPDHGVPIDPLSIQRIEVVRGAATLRYGSQAIGGVVNAINNRVPLDLPDDAFSGEASASYGTGNNARQGSAMIDAKAGGVAFHLDGFGRRTGDYDIPGGRMENSYFHCDGVSAGSSYFFGDSRVGAAIVHYDANYGIPGEEAHIDMRQTKGLFRSAFALGDGAAKTLTVDGGYADYAHSEKEPDGEIGATFKDKEWDSRAELMFDAVGPFSSAALGLQVQHRRFSALGEGAHYLDPTKTKNFAGFMFAEAPLGEAVKLQMGGRVEHVTADGTPADGIAVSRSFTPVSGSAGVLWTASDAVKIGLTASSTARAPGITELFAKGPHDGPGTFETGDSTLGAERANSLEATLRINRGIVKFEGAAWASNFSDYIYGAVTGRTCDEEGVCADDDAGELDELFYRSGGAHFRGLEGRTTVTAYNAGGNQLELNFIADYVRAKLTNGGGNVPRIPPYHLGAGVQWSNAAYDLGVTFKYAGKQTKVAAAETVTKGYVELEAEAAWRPFPDNRSIEFSVVGHNLTNSTQRNAIALNKDEVVQPGRDIRFVARVAF